MTKVNQSNSKEHRKHAPARTPEGQTNRMIAKAINLAEKQMDAGTASSQVITHYLKLAATREKDLIELGILENQKELLSAKTDSLRSAKNMEALYSNAIEAMKSYTSSTRQEDDDCDDYD